LKFKHTDAVYFTIAGLLISIVGQYFIGKFPIPAVLLTTLGFITAAMGVWLAFFRR
jgi:hypothetical protein